LPSLWGRLGELAMPVVLAVGERDSKFRGIAADMAGLMPKSQVVIVPGSGHAVHLQAPEAIAALLIRPG
jgi:pimeloyl-ACP methyl ester carboxylesterase